jgi:hypothetical protein
VTLRCPRAAKSSTKGRDLCVGLPLRACRFLGTTLLPPSSGQPGESHFCIGIDCAEGLPIAPPDALQGSGIEGLLRFAIARAFALELAAHPSSPTEGSRLEEIVSIYAINRQHGLTAPLPDYLVLGVTSET